MQVTPRIPGQELAAITTRTAGLWEAARGQALFVTGGTGFFGRWLLESFLHANAALQLNATLVVLSRDPEAFRQKAPHFFGAGSPVRFIRGDVCRFTATEVKDSLGAAAPARYGLVIHAATEASAQLNSENPLRMTDTIVQGTRAALEFAVASGARRFLLTSSGAVYGRQPSEITHLPEDYCGGPDCTSADSAYAESKRLAELLCACFHKQHGLEPLIARCFAFVGPHLPLDAHFAIGNFIRDALRDGRIAVHGDGTPFRSYLYAADLAVWLWTILFKGEPGRPYNVGSEIDLPIGALAATVAATLGAAGGVTMARQPVAARPPERYVPSTGRARTELGLAETVDLAEAVRRTARFAAR